MGNDVYIIGCIPLHARSKPPPEQKDCTLQPCPKCFAQMWVSGSKRNIMKSKSPLNPQLMCFNCIVRLYPDESTTAQQLDISQVKWMERKVTE
jgi:hypothetical protein